QFRCGLTERRKSAAARRSKASFQGGGVAGCVLCQNCDAASVGGASRRALQASCQPSSGQEKSHKINRMSRPNGETSADGSAPVCPATSLVAKKSCSPRSAHFNRPAAVTTDWATSAIFLFSFIAVLRSKP